MLHRWLPAFLATLLLETPVYLLGAPRSVPRRRALVLALFANGITHPLAWGLTWGQPWSRLVEVELVVWAGESILWRWLGPVPVPQAALLSLTANALSAGVGLLLG